MSIQKASITVVIVLGTKPDGCTETFVGGVRPRSNSVTTLMILEEVS